MLARWSAGSYFYGIMGRKVHLCDYIAGMAHPRAGLGPILYLAPHCVAAPIILFVLEQCNANAQTWVRPIDTCIQLGQWKSPI